MSDITLGGLIRRHAKDRGLRQEELGTLAGKSQTWASKYLYSQDEATIKAALIRLYVNETDRFNNLLDALGLDSTTVLDMAGVPLQEAERSVASSAIPLYDEGEAELLDPVESVRVPINVKGELAAVVVTGDHLGEYLPAGSIAFCALETEAPPGAVALVNIPTIGHCLRRLIEAGPNPMLGTDNGSGRPTFERVKGASIVGMVVRRLVPA